MIYGQSQQANCSQVVTARAVKGLVASCRGTETLQNMGLTTHPVAASIVSRKMSMNHHESVHKFFQNAISNKNLVVIFIDDYHNIHTNHRPSDAAQTQPIHMATLLLKIFQNIQAVYSPGADDQVPEPGNNGILRHFIDKDLSKLEKSIIC